MLICYNCFKKFDESLTTCPHCGEVHNAQPKEPIYLVPGTMLNDRYLIGHAVNAGGFGIVYKAYDIKLQTFVAVKEFYVAKLFTRAANKSDIIVREKAREEFEYRKKRFLEEARCMAKYHAFPCFVHVFEYFEANGTAYIVEEYLNGMDLKTYLAQNNTISVELAMQVAKDIGNALKLMHAQNEIHLDVAPDNIWICNSQTVHMKLFDFGATKIADSDSEVIDIVLKQGYAPVEQYDSAKNIGPWTDIYALGATLYHILTNVKPDEATNRKIEDCLIPPKEINADISDNLNNAILKAMSIDRHMRFKNVDEFLKALGGEKKVESLAKEKRKRKVRRLAGIVLTCVVLLVAGFMTMHYYQKRKNADILQPAEITVWYCAEENSRERDAMELVKREYEEAVDGIVQISLTAFTPEEYNERLSAAAEAGMLPTVFESTGVDAEILSKAEDISSVFASDSFSQALFLDKYESYYTDRKQLPIAIEVPLACVITNGPTAAEYSANTFNNLEDFPEEVIFSQSTEKQELLLKNFGINTFDREDSFLKEDNTSAVLLSTTMEINEIKKAKTGCTYKFVYYAAPAVVCDYTYEWSLGNGSAEELKAGERLLTLLLEDVFQNHLMISACSEGQIPVNSQTFTTKIENDRNTLAPLEEVYTNFVFEK